MLAKKAGVKDVNYVSFDNGGATMIELIGGRVSVFTADASEVLIFLTLKLIKLKLYPTS